MSKVRAIALFSGGLDSILAARVVAEQGVDVIAVHFVTPFFGQEALDDVEAYTARIKEKFGLNVVVEDISKGYVNLLHNPSHGFGKNFNPCVDCKIFMFSRAKEMMKELGASFLITGEVLGQRPMSQRRDTLNVIERDSDNKTQLLRPLSAKHMNPTTVELEGLVDREKLYDFNGRGRSQQIALAKEFGITDYPAPAGGCILADPILSKRIAKVYAGDFVIQVSDITPKVITLMLIGRQFVLPGGGWLILGRDEKENDRLEKLVTGDDLTFNMEERPGPFGLLVNACSFYDDDKNLEGDIQIANSLVVRFGKKIKKGVQGAEVTMQKKDETQVVFAEPIDGDAYRTWVL